MNHACSSVVTIADCHRRHRHKLLLEVLSQREIQRGSGQYPLIDSGISSI
jgi:hypothetical protein